MKFWPTILVAVCVGATAVACGSSDSSTFDGGNGDDASGDDGSVQGTPDGGFIQGDGGQGNTNCKPRTCKDVGANCGPIGDGCGGLVQCGTCTSPESCGAGGQASVCGGSVKCTKKTCSDYPGNSCGPLADGCGGLITCGANNGQCTAPQSCGGGGTPSVCGGNTGCVPKTVAACTGKCGPIADGCGGTVDCGGCATGFSCGGPGKASQCVAAGADAGNCTAKTCSDYPSNSCGPVPDGCGAVLYCGANGGKCTAPQTCGGGGTASVCGGSSGCVPKTCQQLGASCGQQGDGCGGVITCGPNNGQCTPPQTCGGGGTPSVCGGTNACVKKTCSDYPANSCGPLADGCGGTITCGTGCVSPQICGGGGVASVCGGGDGGVVDAGCTGLCQQQVQCDGGATTTVKGVVRAPTPSTYLPSGGKADPIPNAVVYVPNAPVQAFTQQVACTQCGADVTGSPLVKAFSAPDGSFTLTNVPAGTQIPIVIQLGRWRRQIHVDVPACGTVTLTDDQSRFPRTEGEGDPADNIPYTALASGSADPIECVLRKIGIADSEFVKPGLTGRIQFYRSNGASIVSKNQPGLGTLIGTPSTLDTFDQVLLPCEGGQNNKSSTYQQNVVDYTEAGGRVFTTHYGYVWLYQNTYKSSLAQASWQSTGTWNPDPGLNNVPPDPLTANINETFPKGVTFGAWLNLVGALSATNPDQISISNPRHDLDSPLSSNAQEWIYSNAQGTYNQSTEQHYTFNTPVGAAAAKQCGRVVYSDFHVNIGSGSGTFPNECNSDPLTPQEKVLEYMIFDLASCIQPDKPPPPPSCTPATTCPSGTCGPIGDGCGGVLQCGNCPSGQVCGGGGPSKCGGQACTPRTCGAAGANCGQIADGCGNLINCGTCTSPQTCGGGGTPNQCGNPSCVPKTCGQQGFNCGAAGDGCGNLIQCGDCLDPTQSCGGGGSPGVCGSVPCTPQTCGQVVGDAGTACGPVANGCGGITQCGPCPPGQVCGAGGPSLCGAGSCTPRTCAQAGAQCGPIGDGCGGQLDCGPCTQPGQVCGGGGPSKCGGCVRTTCQAQHATCGPIGDGCGGQLDCGTCVSPDTCGGGGVAFQCGHPQVK